MPDSIESIVARIDERTLGMDKNLSTVLDRLKWVESVASDVKEYPEFREYVQSKIDKFDEACTKSQACPDRLNKIESSVAAIDSRVGSLEKSGIQEAAQKDMASKLWDIANKPVFLWLAALAYLFFEHVGGNP